MLKGINNVGHSVSGKGKQRYTEYTVFIQKRVIQYHTRYGTKRSFVKVTDLGKYRLTSRIYVILQRHNIKNWQSSAMSVKKNWLCGHSFYYDFCRGHTLLQNGGL